MPVDGRPTGDPALALSRASKHVRRADDTAAWDEEQLDPNGRLSAVRRASRSVDMLVAPRKQGCRGRWG